MDADFAKLMKMRQSHKRPTVVVVTDDYFTANNAKKSGLSPLIVKPGSTYDWRVVRGLNVMLITHKKRETLTDIVKSIFDQNPRWLLWNDKASPDLPIEWVIPCPC